MGYRLQIRLWLNIGNWSLRAPLIIFLLCVTGVLAGPSSASAGTYTVYSCGTPDRSAGNVADWQFTAQNPSRDLWSSSCPAGPLWMRLDPSVEHSSGEKVVADFAAPSDTAITQYTLYRAVRVAGSTPYYYTQREGHGGVFDVFDHCWGEDPCGTLGDAMDPFGASSAIRRISPSGGFDALRMTVGCYNDPHDPCGPVAGAGAELRLSRAEITLEDALPPILTTPPSGPLTSSSGALTGVQPVSISASDRGSGVYQAAFEVDGTVVQRAVIDSNGGDCRAPFTRAAPCLPVASATLGFDTSQLADGGHQLRLLVSDAAGNVTPWGPIKITTANASCNPHPRGTGMRLTARLRYTGSSGGRSRATVVAAFGRRVVVSGRLRADATPLPGADICVVSRDDKPGAGLNVEGRLQTDAQGRYSYDLAPGRSRAIWVVHRTSDGAISGRVRLGVRAYVSVTPSQQRLRNGQRLELAGRTAKPTSKRGVLVLFEVRRGDHWQVFKRAQTNSRGRFRSAYRFTRTFRTQRYRFRAVVPEQGGYPYATGASRSIVVTVQG
jgi:hypothetical protein